MITRFRNRREARRKLAIMRQMMAELSEMARDGLLAPAKEQVR